MINTVELQKRISTTNDAGLIAMLLERLIDNFNNCILKMETKEYHKVNELNNHSRAILTELLVQFSGDDEISLSLREINLYVNTLMTKGENDKDSLIFETCIHILTPLLEGFKELELQEKPKVVAGLTYGKNNLGEYELRGNKSFEG